MPMETITIPLPTISQLPDGRIALTNDVGTSIIFDADEPHFNLDDQLNEIKEVISWWLSKQHSHTQWRHYFHPSQASVRATYEAQGSIQIRRYVP